MPQGSNQCLSVIILVGHARVHLPHFMQSGSRKPLSCPRLSYGVSCMGHTRAQLLHFIWQALDTCTFVNASGIGSFLGATQRDIVPMGQNVHHVLGA